MKWKEMSLGEGIAVKHGFAFKSEYFSPDGDFVVLTPGNFHEIGGFKFRPGKDRFYSSSFPDDFLLKKDELIVAMTEQGAGLLGSSALIPSDNRYLHNQRLGKVVVTEPSLFSTQFLYWLFNTREVRSQISGSATGTKVRHTAPERIYRVRAKFPPLPTQQRIASILSSYDDLIENNRRRIHLLEESARLLYREWFVHLRFPGHENTTVKNGVPEGWSDGRIDDFYDTSSGGTPSRKNLNFYDGEIPWIKTKELNGSFIFQTDEKISEEALKLSSAKLFPKNTVLLAMYGATVGRIGITSGEAATNQACCALLPKDPRCHFPFTYLFLDHFAETFVSLSAGAAQKNISQGIIRNFPMTLPPSSLANSFENFTSDLFNQRRFLEQQNTHLARARDLLLPKLMSGEIEV